MGIPWEIPRVSSLGKLFCEIPMATSTPGLDSSSPNFFLHSETIQLFTPKLTLRSIIRDYYTVQSFSALCNENLILYLDQPAESQFVMCLMTCTLNVDPVRVVLPSLLSQTHDACSFQYSLVQGYHQ